MNLTIIGVSAGTALAVGIIATQSPKSPASIFRSPHTTTPLWSRMRN